MRAASLNGENLANTKKKRQLVVMGHFREIEKHAAKMPGYRNAQAARALYVKKILHMATSSCLLTGENYLRFLYGEWLLPVS